MTTVLPWLLSVAALLDFGCPAEVAKDLRANRTSKELHAGEGKSLPDVGDRKWTSDVYHTLSSLTPDVTVDAVATANTKSSVYPPLTTGSPSFVTRGRYIRNPYYYNNKNDQEMEIADEQHADVVINAGVPRWNRYNINHRQLNKYGPAPVEADITVDEDGSTGYGSTFDYVGGSGYDSGSSMKNAGGWVGGDSMAGWYSEPVSQHARPVPIIAEIRHPSSKMGFDMGKIGMLAMIKIGLAKLKALGFVKALLLLLLKLKFFLVLLLFKFLMLLKMMKLLKLLLLPFLLSLALPLLLPLLLTIFPRLMRLLFLLSQPALVPNTNTNTTPNPNETLQKRRSHLDPIELLDPNLAQIRNIVQSEKCIQRIACRLAGTQSSFTSIWTNWTLQQMSKYIPNKRLESYVTTFNDVSDRRLQHLLGESSPPDDWTKWCTEQYDCDEATNKLETSE
ncbi:uncharacterized protein LOC126846764 [Adelges cooleyi]|uniref:uncharacterized protein LOC126846764 n=1 Tax=Adelges cooleyi TaxID=133065 RepID=UPI00217F5BB3|nr:uncharacterized protein LOC126846764 [Adelges cooleyi]